MLIIFAFPSVKDKARERCPVDGISVPLKEDVETKGIKDGTLIPSTGHVSYNYRRLAMFLAFLFFIIPSVKEKEKGKEASHR